MKNFLLITFLFLISASAFAQIRVEKRRYNKGWYISLNHKKNQHGAAATTGEELQDTAIAPAEIKAETIALTENEIPEAAMLNTETGTDSVSEKTEMQVQKPPLSLKTEARKYPERIAGPSAIQELSHRESVPHAIPLQEMKQESSIQDPGDDIMDWIEDVFSLLVLVITLGLLLGLAGIIILIIINPTLAIVVLLIPVVLLLSSLG